MVLVTRLRLWATAISTKYGTSDGHKLCGYLPKNICEHRYEINGIRNQVIESIQTGCCRVFLFESLAHEIRLTVSEYLSHLAWSCMQKIKH